MVFCLEDVFEDFIFAWWNIWVFIILPFFFCLKMQSHHTLFFCMYMDRIFFMDSSFLYALCVQQAHQQMYSTNNNVICTHFSLSLSSFHPGLSMSEYIYLNYKSTPTTEYLTIHSRGQKHIEISKSKKYIVKENSENVHQLREGVRVSPWVENSFRNFMKHFPNL